MSSYRYVRGSHRGDLINVELEGLCKPMVKTKFSHEHLFAFRNSTIGRWLPQEPVSHVVSVWILQKWMIKTLYYLMDKRMRNRYFCGLLNWLVEVFKVLRLECFLTVSLFWLLYIPSYSRTMQMIKFTGLPRVGGRQEAIWGDAVTILLRNCISFSWRAAFHFICIKR